MCQRSVHLKSCWKADFYVFQSLNEKLSFFSKFLRCRIKVRSTWLFVRRTDRSPQVSIITIKNQYCQEIHNEPKLGIFTLSHLQNIQIQRKYCISRIIWVVACFGIWAFPLKTNWAVKRSIRSGKCLLVIIHQKCQNQIRTSPEIARVAIRQ